MIPSRPSAALLALVLLGIAACGPIPTETASPSTDTSPAAVAPTAVASDLPFTPVSWPATGSACPVGAAPGWISKIEAPDAKTVVFTLCAPDGAFLARLAHPAMGIVDAAELARIAKDPAALRDVAGHGGYRAVLWGDADVQLERVGAAASAAVAPTVILRWSADPATRTADLVAGSVDGIDAPTADGLTAAATNPALTVVPRGLLATSVLGFGSGAAFNDVRVRRAIASGIDTGSLADTAFPVGSTAANFIAPCEVPAGCAGSAFPSFNGPASVAALQGVKFDFDAPYPLTVPDEPIPGLPNPVAAAAGVRDQFAANLGLTLTITTLPADQFRAAVDGGTLSGLYLDGVAATLADPSAFYDPLFLAHPDSLAARRAVGASGDLQAAASDPSPAARAADYASAANSLRDSVPVVPLVHPGSATVYQADVQGAAASPLGEDPLGAMVAGDRGQVVFEQATAPAGGWCGPQASADAYRLCALVTDGLYGYAPGSLDPAPSLASACTPDTSALVWTCRLRMLRTGDGLVLDAADVVATFRAMADPSDPVHLALGDAAFAAWAQLFGAQSGAPPAPTPTPTATETATPTASSSSAPVPGASISPGPSGHPSPSAP
jgi:peptide/nickel transport system substrate-binding protein